MSSGTEGSGAVDEFDIVVIGGGPGGYVAAIRGAQKGGKVALVEKDRVGGTCLNRGCIPTKTLYYSAKHLITARHGERFGIKAEGGVTFDLAKAIARKDEVVEKLTGGVGQLLKANGVTVFDGTGYIEDPATVTVKGEAEATLKTKNIIIATGSEPALIPAFNIDGENVLTSTEALNLTELPESMLIIGAGVMGCEFASIYATFGTKITMVELMASLLPMEDKAVSRAVAKSFKGAGVDVHTGVSVESVTAGDGGVTTKLTDGTEIVTEKVLVSIGRAFNSTGIGLEEAGVELDRGAVVVNSRMETNVKGIYAIGDVVGGMLLAHVASVEGGVAVNNALGGDEEMDYSCVPSGIFTEPEVATVGLKEVEAKEKGIDVSIGRFPYQGSGKALAMGEEDGFIQVLADPETDRVLGASIVGAHATDLIGEVALAVNMGCKVHDITETIHAHPTLPEIVLEGLEDVHGLAIHKAGRRKR